MADDGVEGKRNVGDVLADFFMNEILEEKRQKKHKKKNKRKRKKKRHHSRDSSVSESSSGHRQSRSNDRSKKRKRHRSNSRSSESRKREKKRKELRLLGRDCSANKDDHYKKKHHSKSEDDDFEKPAQLEPEISFEEKKPKETVCPQSLTMLKLSQMRLKKQVEQIKSDLEENADASPGLESFNGEKLSSPFLNVGSKTKVAQKEPHVKQEFNDNPEKPLFKSTKKNILLTSPSLAIEKSDVEVVDSGDKQQNKKSSIKMLSSKEEMSETIKLKKHKESSEHSRKKKLEDKDDSRYWEKGYHYKRSPDRRYSRSSHRGSNDRERRHSPDKRSSEKSSKIDKAKLLEVARKKAIQMIQTGVLSLGYATDSLKKENMVSLKAGGKSVKELTDFCRNLSSKEKATGGLEPSTCDDQRELEPSDEPFIHHPFKVKESPFITFNIRNSVRLPVKTHAEKLAETARSLTQQFPVSSGDMHRELEWIPVETNVPKTSAQTAAPMDTSATNSEQKKVLKGYIQPPLPPPEPPPPPPPPPSLEMNPVACMPPVPSPLLISYPETCSTIKEYSASTYNQPTLARKCHPNKNFDISTLVAKRFKALTKLQQNPYDFEAKRDIEEVDLEVQAWVQAQQVPGQFTGSTKVKFLTPAELCGPPVWVKKDFFTKAAPLTEGKGMSLLKKMGWTPGEGLGKNKEGALEPLSMDIKTDKKGLSSVGEAQLAAQNLKHPVSVLIELCSKRKWHPPTYTTINECGPSHKKSFRMKVEVNNKEYVPLISFQNKKQAKAEAAKVCLQSLGLLYS